MKQNQDTKKLWAVLISLVLLVALPAVLARSGDDSSSSGGGSIDDNSQSGIEDNPSRIGNDDNSVGDDSGRGADESEDNGVDDRREDRRNDADDGVDDMEKDRRNDADDDGLNDAAEDEAVDRRRGADKPEDDFQVGAVMSRNTAISQNKAIEIANGVVSGTVDRVEQELEDGVLVWKVRLSRDEDTRVDVRINAQTGNVLRSRIRGEDFDIRQRSDVEVRILNKNTAIDENDAADIAKKAVSGGVDRIEQENEDGRLAWKVRVVAQDGTRTDVMIDAETGDVLRLRVEEDKDKDGISDDLDSNTGRDTDKDNDGMDDSVDTEDDRSFFQKILSMFGLF